MLFRGIPPCPLDDDSFNVWSILVLRDLDGGYNEALLILKSKTPLVLKSKQLDTVIDEHAIDSLPPNISCIVKSDTRRVGRTGAVVGGKFVEVVVVVGDDDEFKAGP